MTYEPTDLRIHRPLFRVRVLLARSTNTEMTNGLSTALRMKTQRKQSRTARCERPNQIKVAFAQREPTRRIRLLLNAACAARGGAERMRLADWCEVEAELTQKFENGLRSTGARAPFFPLQRGNNRMGTLPDNFRRRAGFCFVPQAKALCVGPARRPRFAAPQESTRRHTLLI